MNKYPIADHELSWILPKHVHLTCLLLLFLLMRSTARGQINASARVAQINAAKTTLGLTNVNQAFARFMAGRQVVVLQMQDDVIGANTGNSQSFGNLGAIGKAGLFETATIQSFNGVQMVLSSPLVHNYNTGPNSRVQVVSFNQLGNPDFATNETIEAEPWNGNTGGVIAFQVEGTLTLRHSIRADGAGFRGGNASADENSDCQPGQYTSANNDYGAKGEGIYGNSTPGFRYGRGKLINGGGGGNGRNAGGGGGGNYTAGGEGGAGRSCSNDESGGLGGISLNTYLMTGNRVFMGGGGGGGQGNSGNQTRGGNGGGIILIKAHTITTSFVNLETITANGEHAPDTRRDGNDGAGGAGAGGTVLLQVNRYNMPFLGFLSIEASGGNGGDVENNIPHGGGGGGAQGAILFSGAQPTGTIFTSTRNGQGGLNSNGFGASRAGSGTGLNNAGIVTGVGTPLPVRLLYFTAEKFDKKARLQWTATDELNTVFNIQQSTDGIQFTTVGTIKGTGSGNAVTSYTFTHAVPAPGVNFYRLEMKEEPDFQSYSSIASVTFTGLSNTPMAYPNPAHDHFSMRITDIDNNISYAVQIADLAGRTVFTTRLKPVNNIITVHTGDRLLPGTYLVTVATGAQKHFVKLIVR